MDEQNCSLLETKINRHAHTLYCAYSCQDNSVEHLGEVQNALAQRANQTVVDPVQLHEREEAIERSFGNTKPRHHRPHHHHKNKVH